ncbi:pyrroloquinoline quinone biosynthesis protein PqqE [Sporotomaculum syntrophicum]|uniref:Pyrroloquinoline quinone biosynthesis protein PqqE n=1 Tax=Sporotomaculum syntrophicum TaxID=182264 RepID=A0A9D3AXK1_9FIRM|nr:SPASM domain-containing protein [Sporotomaculum syntrophicum]KAF1083804.1 pyrroloquinoline quinone biosynthesis protein PqqE [Sporotomaculum syntrophicum]
MRKQTEHVKQLKKMYIKEDDRIKGEGYWEKFPLFWFTLFLSFRCTRRCTYCYTFEQVSDGSTLEMNDNTFARLLEWIPEVWKVNNVKVNVIGFLGGEPLLNTKRIKKVMDSIYKNTDGMQGYIYTNGDLVDSVNWDDLEDIQWITTSISNTSIEETARRMKIIGERSNVIGQTVEATMDDFNLERLLDITRFGLENGYRLRYQKDCYRGLDAEYHARLLKRYHELLDLLESYIIKGYDVHTTFLLDTLIPLWAHEASPYPCGKRNAVIFPDGSVGACIRNHSTKFGTIFDKDPLSIIQCEKFHYDISMPDIPDECRACEFRTTCQGGCPHDKLLMTGSRAGKSINCDIHKEIIPRLRYLDELQNRRKDHQ